MTLPSDITRCVSMSCPRHQDCARWVCRGDDNARVFIVGVPESCEYFIRYEPENPESD